MVAALRSRREHLLGVHPRLRVEGAPHARLRREIVLREDERHEVALLQSDTVLAGEDPARVDAEANDLLRGREDLLERSGNRAVEREQRMEVPVARVEDVQD